MPDVRIYPSLNGCEITLSLNWNEAASLLDLLRSTVSQLAETDHMVRHDRRVVLTKEEMQAARKAEQADLRKQNLAKGRKIERYVRAVIANEQGKGCKDTPSQIRVRAISDWAKRNHHEVGSAKFFADLYRREVSAKHKARRQRELIRHYKAGLSNAQIAEKMGLKPSYVGNLISKHRRDTRGGRK